MWTTFNNQNFHNFQNFPHNVYVFAVFPMSASKDANLFPPSFYAMIRAFKPYPNHIGK